MPELPEVETGRRIADRVLAGRTLKGVAVADDRIVFAGVAPRTFARRLKGRRIVATHRRGKQMWFELDCAPHPLLHLGMTGRFHVYDRAADRPRFWKVEFTTDTGERLAMTNARRLGRIRLQDDPPGDLPIRKLGFDPLLDMPTARTMHELIATRKAPLKAILLDQSFAAGVGNWIADEVLYQARLSPHRRGNELTADETKRLRAKLGAIIRKAVDVDADKNRFPRTWLFHQRWGREDGASIAGRPIVHETVGGRTTAWVPEVQNG